MLSTGTSWRIRKRRRAALLDKEEPRTPFGNCLNTLINGPVSSP